MLALSSEALKNFPGRLAAGDDFAVGGECGLYER